MLAGRWLVPAVAALVLAGCGRVDPNGEFQAAVELAKAGDGKSWEKAVARAESAMRAGGNTAALRGFHVLALYRSGKTDETVERARDAARDFPDSFLCQFLAGKILLESGDALAALGPLRQAYELEPDNQDCVVLLARCATMQNVPDAEAALEKLMDGNQAHLAANEMGVFLVNQGRYPEAMSWFSRTSSMSDNPSVYLNMAVLCDRYMKKPTLARRYYTKYMLETGDRFPTKNQMITARLRQLFATQN
jgi:tetratricopeptide (TPR) repeat protein